MLQQVGVDNAELAQHRRADAVSVLAIANKQAQITTKAATETGFTPASRSRITLPVAAADKLDPWNEIAG
ncbi:MAG: hypothetical protein IPK44_12680 [Candidatus Accumulibacter sp.]|uniref:hypothetical protein n=1 Tax=Accumulibacter sp. TaxID=2053492 RepID=UPI0025894458|nr:hypothetical protein [Accumulibacter sp.]MBK8115317.1 hypothetical protein [Accumulibacter sp.]